MNRRELDKQLGKLYFFGKFICSNISHVDTLLSQTEKYSRMLSGKINDFANSHGSESSLQLNQNCEQVLNGKGEENLSDSVSYHPTDSETSDDEAYMRKEMAYDRENNFDYVAEVRDLQDDASIPIEKLLRLHSEIQEHSNIGREEDVKSLLAEFISTGEKVDCFTSRFSLSPFLLKHSLREYQETGLKWLASCYENSMNGILADEMGLGKTIQTISLLAYLACHRGSWGPHLIIVPTSVMLNWEVEFKKWCPAFKILTYFGSQKERKIKRRGWSKPNSFHICITTYRLVVQDQIVFRRKKWGYMILDEAHLIKNWRSQRWQTLLHFNSNRRLLLTGTPLQNNLMELWSLMHFLMPTLFQSHSEFKSWFSNPLMEMVDDGDLVDQSVIARLHDVLRPFILRRLKKDVERNLPEKKERIIYCQLSRRQRRLYEEYISSSDTSTILGSGNLLGVINCLMQLRKVCNHPDLFAGRAIVSSLDLLPCIYLSVPALLCSLLNRDHARMKYLQNFDCFEFVSTAENFHSMKLKDVNQNKNAVKDGWKETGKDVSLLTECMLEKMSKNANGKDRERLEVRSTNEPLICRVVNKYPLISMHAVFCEKTEAPVCRNTAKMISSIHKRARWIEQNFRHFFCVIPHVRASAPRVFFGSNCGFFYHSLRDRYICDAMSYFAGEFRYIVVRQQLFFHDKRLIQYDCGKLQKLAHLLRALRNGGHKVLIFTQMTKMLDVLESFLNLYGYSYCRLDGSTKPEQRQLLVQRFNTDAKLFVFILSTRSGGFGINLTGADTVIFYDTDWNPAIDSQAQDRCHRIGQKREVSIYRLISEGTVEENIMKKAMRKSELDRVAIQSAMFDSFHGKKGMRFFNPCVYLNLFLFSGDVRVRENISLSDVQPELKENEVLLNVSITSLE
jgi:SNF2 family DNA or RNA helicase